ncbi:NmrA/HSCARG family protein [Pseudomonadota bacterium]
MTKPLTVLVTGATGNQGGAVAKALINNKHNVIALTRNPKSVAAIELAKLGAEVVTGSLEAPLQLADTLKRVDTLFLMGGPMETSVEQEIAQGLAIVDVAKSANVGHLVYSSVANANKNTGIPHFESKYKVEQYIRSQDIPFTICAPVAFMENVVAPWSIDAFKAHKIVQALPDEIKLQQISLRNFGEFVADIVEKRESVFGQRFDIAGDEVTGDEMATVLTNATHQTISYESFPTSELRKVSDDMATMFEWLADTGYDVDKRELHEQFNNINWQNYTQWAESANWSLLKN